MTTAAQKSAMDGANFVGASDRGKTPADFTTDPTTGKRPEETRTPWGSAKTDVTHGDLKNKTLPPRSIWKEGKWKGSKSYEYAVWVVSGEGTPGNYAEREYELPTEIAATASPPHPLDWPKKLKEELKSKPYGSQSGSGSYSSGPSLPWGLRVRCPGCGHFYKMDDLAGHTKNACPSTQMVEMGYVLYVIECECCPNLQQTATIIEGFPITVQASEATSQVTVVETEVTDGGSPTAA